MDGQTIGLILVLAVTSAGALAGLVGWLFRKDTEIEGRRRVAAQLTCGLQKLGLDRLASLTSAYSIGDYSGLYGGVKSLAEDINGGEGLNLLRKSFFTQFASRLTDAGDLTKIRKLLADFDLANPQVVVTAPEVAAGVKKAA